MTRMRSAVFVQCRTASASIAVPFDFTKSNDYFISLQICLYPINMLVYCVRQREDELEKEIEVALWYKN